MELVGDPLNGVADSGVQAAFGRAWNAEPEVGQPHRPAVKANRAAVRRLLAEGELRQARIVGVRGTNRSVQFGSA